MTLGTVVAIQGQPVQQPGFVVPVKGQIVPGSPLMPQQGQANVIYPATVVPVYANAYDRPVVGMPIAPQQGIPIAQALPVQAQYQYQVPQQQMQMHIKRNEQEEKRRKRQERDRRHDSYRNDRNDNSYCMYGGYGYGYGYGYDSYYHDQNNYNYYDDRRANNSMESHSDPATAEDNESGSDDGDDGFGDEAPDDFDDSAFAEDAGDGADDGAGDGAGIGGDELADVDMYGGAGPQDLPGSDYTPPQSDKTAVLAALRRQYRCSKNGMIAGSRPRGFEFEENKPAVGKGIGIGGEEMQQAWEKLEQQAEETVLGRTDALDFVSLSCAFPEHALANNKPTPLARALGIQLNISRCTPARAPSKLMLTLVTQLSVDRLGALAEQVLAWEGPVSAAIYIPYTHDDARAIPVLHDIAACYEKLVGAEGVRDCRGPGGACELRISLLWSREQGGLVELKEANEEAETMEARAKRAQSQYDSLYPVNALRNLALKAASTDLVLLLDVDFVPSAGAHDAIAKDEQLRQEATRCNTAFVLPAFEQHPTNGAAGGAAYSAVPRSKEALVALGEEASAFHIGHFAKGHASTDYTKWFSTGSKKGVSNAYRVEYSESYEPYVVMARKSVPMYDERFRGYGMNKISHLYAVASQGTCFKVLPSQFVIAREHAKSTSWVQTFGTSADPVQKVRVALLYRRFKQDVDRAQRQHLSAQCKEQVQHTVPGSALHVLLQVPIKLPLAALGVQSAPPLLELADADGTSTSDTLVFTGYTTSALAQEILEEVALAKQAVEQAKEDAEEVCHSANEAKLVRKRTLVEQQQEPQLVSKVATRPAARRFRVVALP
jgi:glycosyltransferase-like protein LARGE